MEKEIAKQLKQQALYTAEMFSNSNRENNVANETFEINEIIPTSDQTAIVIYKKSPSNKLALCFFYYRKGRQSGWYNFFPTDSHIAGLKEIERYKYSVEKHNYKYNFD